MVDARASAPEVDDPDGDRGGSTPARGMVGVPCPAVMASRAVGRAGPAIVGATVVGPHTAAVFRVAASRSRSGVGVAINVAPSSQSNVEGRAVVTASPVPVDAAAAAADVPHFGQRSDDVGRSWPHRGQIM